MATIYDRLLLVKTETTKGTDAVPTPAANAIRCVSFNFTKTQNNIDRAVVKQSMGNLPHLIDPDSSWTVEVVVDLKGSGTAGTAPEFGPLFLACRMLETVSAGTAVAYNPSTVIEKSITIYGYKEGQLFKATGAVGNCAITNDRGAPAQATFTLQAAYIAPAVAAVPAGAVFDATAPVVASSSDAVSDGTTIRTTSFGIDFGNDVQEHRTTSNHEFVVANRAPTLTFTKDSIGTASEWTALAAGTAASISSTTGATAGNILAITAANGKRTSVAHGERAERDTLDVAYNLFETATDDQFEVKFS